MPEVVLPQHTVSPTVSGSDNGFQEENVLSRDDAKPCRS